MPVPVDNALSRRAFTVVSHQTVSELSAAASPSTSALPSSSTAPSPSRAASVAVVPLQTTPRQLKRIHVAAEILKARKICAGDAMVVMHRPRQRDESAAAVVQDNATQDELVSKLEQVNLDRGSASGQVENDHGHKFAIGVAWPSFSLSAADSAVALSPLMMANSGLRQGDKCTIATLQDSGVRLHEAAKIVVIHDGKGKRKAATSNDGSKPGLFEAYVKEMIIDLKIVAVHHFVQVVYNGVQRKLLVDRVKISGSKTWTIGRDEAFLVTRSTEVVFRNPGETAPKLETRPPRANGNADLKLVRGTAAKSDALPGYESVGGMASQIEQIRELVEWPLTRPELYTHFGLKPPKGVLLYGPPGTGKTLLAFSIAKSTNSTLFTINGPSLSSAYHGETESRLRQVFEEAKSKSPAVIVIDEVDALAPNREDGSEVERRVVATLLTLMDGLEDKQDVRTGTERGDDPDSEDDALDPQESEPPRVVVIAATNRPNAIDPALRRPGRFDREIEIGVPDAASRLSILQVLLRKVPHDVDESALGSIASRTHGFVGADLASLIHSAGLSAIKRTYSAMISVTNATSLSDQRLTLDDLEHALLSTRPSAMREVFLETPKVYWSDIGGQTNVKARLRESVEWPLLHPEAFKRLGVKPPRGVLLYGPPGCSKTLIAKALATEGGLNFIAVKGPEVFNKYVGESEKAVREVFRKARAAAPSVVFLDEIDSLAPARGSDDSGGATSDRVLMSLLTEMDGIEELNGVVVLAATNRPDVIDPALMRPGRLDRILYVAPPDFDSRVEIFKINTKAMAVEGGLDLSELARMASETNVHSLNQADRLLILCPAKQTEGCSGAEIASICQDAALAAMNENINAPFVAGKHFVESAKTVRRRITPQVIREYEAWRDSSGLRSA
ncbi:AAA+-type ATPase [Microbotryomycetes sp. JL201]|nr:AAA+-type ATPase [Microbotryomycetes sp. JL201]